MKVEKYKVLILITNSFAATNIIHSGLIKPLADEFDVSMLSSLIDANDMREINAFYNIDVKLQTFSIPQEKFLSRTLRRVQKAFFFKLNNIETEKIRSSERNSLTNQLMNIVISFISVIGLGDRIQRALRKMIINSSMADERYSILGNNLNDLVISTSPLDIRENMIVNNLKRNGVLSIGMIISWDNLTSKGIINADYDEIYVWNELMYREYLQFYSVYDIAAQKVKITGVPRFDIYYKDLPESFSRENFNAQFDIANQDKVILFATSAKRHFPTQTDILDHLIEFAKDRVGIKILVRCHPADDFSLYSKYLNYDRVTIWHPDDVDKQSETFYKWMPNLDILNSLTAMLRYSDILVNVASTMTLDAAVCNKPIISIAYDGNVEKEYNQSVRRFYDYSHQIPLNSIGANIMVGSKEELFFSIENILSSPHVSDDSVNEVVTRFCHYTEPKSIPTIVKYVNECLR